MVGPRIGCIAWGSLLWDPRTLPLAAPFVQAGPWLPIEFSRVALDGRVTLVIDPLAAPVRTWWAPLAVDSLEAGIAALALREGISPERTADWVGVETRRAEAPTADPGPSSPARSTSSSTAAGPAPPALDSPRVGARPLLSALRSPRASIAAWLAEEPLDAVVWTALPARRPDGRFERPAVDELEAHLRALPEAARARAEQYIRRAPAMLRTPNRQRFESAFGWTREAGRVQDR